MNTPRGFLYRLDFDSGKRYVGITKRRSVRQRVDQHRFSAMTKASTFAVHCAWRKYGEPSTVILAIASGDYLLDLERRAVRAYGTYGPGGYNLTPGGDFNPMSTAAARAKLSVLRKGVKLSAEWRLRLSLAHKGKKLSARHIAAHSEAMKGHVVSKETREKISAAQRGRVFSAEQRANIGAAGKGRIATAEARKNLSRAGKLRYAKERALLFVDQKELFQ